MAQIAVHVEDEGDSASGGQRRGGKETGAVHIDDVGGETGDFPGQAGQLAREAEQIADELYGFTPEPTQLSIAIQSPAEKKFSGWLASLRNI